MRLALAFVVLACSLPALAEEPKVSGDVICADDFEICRENCSLELGTSQALKDKIATCQDHCEQAQIVCLQRFIAKRAATPRSGPTEAKEPKKEEAPREEYSAGAPTRYSQDDAPASPRAKPDEVAPVPRSATRTNELQPAPDTEVIRYPDRAAAPGPAPEARRHRQAASELDAPAGDPPKEKTPSH
jgi:hypothetical protein